MRLLIRPEIGFTYDCRQCEKPVTASAGLFSLRTRRWVCRCGCGESALVACVEQERLITEYPCPICGRRHRSELPLGPILSGRIVPLRCPATDTASVYVGPPEQLRRMDSPESDEEIARFVGRLVGIPPKPQHQDVESKDCPSSADLLCTARSLAERGCIRCRCGSRRFTAAAEQGVLTVTCPACGAEKRLFISTKSELAKIRDCGMLILQKT